MYVGASSQTWNRVDSGGVVAAFFARLKALRFRRKAKAKTNAKANANAKEREGNAKAEVNAVCCLLRSE
jgi:hypothetical protein